MSLIGRFVAFVMLMLVALSVGWSTPAAAQNTTGEYRGALDSIYLEMNALWGELDRFKVEARYCRPPPPSKAQAQAELDALERRVADLNRRYQAMRQSLLSFLDHNHRLYSELMVNGVDPRDRRWWTRYENSRKQMLDELAAKKAALAAAPEVNCGGTTTQRPPVTAAPPQAQPTRPQSSLPQRPSYDPLNWPPMPPHFCSWDEYWKFINGLINPLYEKAAENAERAAKFRSAVEQAVNDHVQNDRPVPPALAALRRQAIADVAEQIAFPASPSEIRAPRQGDSGDRLPHAGAAGNRQRDDTSRDRDDHHPGRALPERQPARRHAQPPVRDRRGDEGGLRTLRSRNL